MPADRLARLLRASRFGFVILGGLYTVGLLIVNIDLARYGLLSLDLGRAEYVMAGALWCFLIVATIAGIDYCTNSIKIKRAHRARPSGNAGARSRSPRARHEYHVTTLHGRSMVVPSSTPSTRPKTYWTSGSARPMGRVRGSPMLTQTHRRLVAAGRLDGSSPARVLPFKPRLLRSPGGSCRAGTTLSTGANLGPSVPRSQVLSC